MAFFNIEYYSNALIRTTSFKVLIPNDPRDGAPFADTEDMKTLFILHGYTGNAFNWVPDEVTAKHKFAIVMPTGENSFYLDAEASGQKYQTMVGVELVDYMRRTFHLCRKPEDTFIAGFSMGGYGALHLGLAYPDTFGKIGALSSALLPHGIAHMKPGTGNGTANYEYYHTWFGDLETVEERDTNCEVQIKNLKAAGKKIPEMYICCGTEDFLIRPNRQLHDFLLAEDVPHEYHEGPGIHDMKFWHEYIAKIADWMFE